MGLRPRPACPLTSARTPSRPTAQDSARERPAALETTAPAYDAARHALTPEQAERLAVIGEELRSLLAITRADAIRELQATHAAILEMATTDEAAADVAILLARLDDLSAYF